MSILTSKIEKTLKTNKDIKETISTVLSNSYVTECNNLNKGIFSFNSCSCIDDYIRKNMVQQSVEYYNDTAVKKNYRKFNEMATSDTKDLIPFLLNNFTTYYKLKANTNDVTYLKQKITENINKQPISELRYDYEFYKKIFYSSIALKIYESENEEISVDTLNVKPVVKYLFNDSIFDFYINEYNEDDTDTLNEKVLSAIQSLFSTFSAEDFTKIFHDIFNNFLQKECVIQMNSLQFSKFKTTNLIFSYITDDKHTFENNLNSVPQVEQQIINDLYSIITRFTSLNFKDIFMELFYEKSN